MQEVKTDKAPSPLGPYSQAVIANDIIYVAMQLPIATDTDSSATIEQQTKQVLNNIKLILEAANSSMSNIVKVTIYLTDLSDGKIINPIYAEYFNDILPARSIVNVCTIPFGYKIAVDAIATL